MYPQLYTGASGMVASSQKLDLVANNLANVRTPGYLPDHPLFSTYLGETLLEEAGPTPQAPRQVDLAGHWRPETPGPMQSTGNDLDLAIQGRGFFRVETPQGERLTRAGAMTRSTNGSLATSDGNYVLDEFGKRIQLPEGNVTVTSDGTLTVGDEVVARLGLASGSVNTMLREGAALWNPQGPTAPLPAEQADILQGYLEQSSVKPTQELVNMIEAQRLFDMQQRVVNITANTVMKKSLELGESK